MAPATGTALILLGAFVLPGFVSLLIRERTFVLPRQQAAFERLLNALYYSALIYAIAVAIAWLLGLEKEDLADFYRGRKTLGEDLAAAAILAVVLPTGLSLSALRWHRSKKLRPRLLGKLGVDEFHGIESAWDRGFASNGRVFVRVRLKEDAGTVGGFFGGRSFASYSDQSTDLFIQQPWSLDEDGWFAAAVPDTRGMWIAADEIARVEFYEVPAE